MSNEARNATNRYRSALARRGLVLKRVRGAYEIQLQNGRVLHEDLAGLTIEQVGAYLDPGLPTRGAFRA